MGEGQDGKWLVTDISSLNPTFREMIAEKMSDPRFSKRRKLTFPMDFLMPFEDSAKEENQALQTLVRSRVEDIEALGFKADVQSHVVRLIFPGLKKKVVELTVSAAEPGTPMEVTPYNLPAVDGATFVIPNAELKRYRKMMGTGPTGERVEIPVSLSAKEDVEPQLGKLLAVLRALGLLPGPFRLADFPVQNDRIIGTLTGTRAPPRI